MDIITIFFIMSTFTLLGIISILYNRNIVIYDLKSKEVLCILTTKINKSSILKNGYDLIKTDNTQLYEVNPDTGRIYLKK